MSTNENRLWFKTF
uniref:Uncharacterized protein n=1 Tax=Arundo donax TaxID=35708 RepID=A0A0A9EEC0_ARUDO